MDQKKGIIAVGLFIMGMAYGYQHFNRVSKSEPVVVDEEFYIPQKVKRKPASQAQKVKAAPVETPAFKAEVTTSKREDELFDHTTPAISDAGANNAGGGGFLNSSSPEVSPNETSRNRSSSQKQSGSRSNSQYSDQASASTNLTSGDGGTTFSNVGYPTTSASTDNDSTSDSDSKVEDTLTCSVDVGGGNFQNPVQVRLQCSAQAQIKYCIQEGSCCSPETQGQIYSGPITLGQDGGNFCLSFYGDSDVINKTSGTINHSYNIALQIPDLKTSFPKTYFQTTQLTDYYFLTSNDFGKANYEIGGLNLKTHDPGPGGLNMDCDEIVENYVALPAPAATQMFNPIDLLGVILGNQLNIPMMASNLDYGENYVTNYVANRTQATPVYACSTNKITLNDFDFFAMEDTHGEVGSNTVQEFSGGFVSYGFFEEDNFVNRGPAGVASETESGQGLQVGSFAIYYE